MKRLRGRRAGFTLVELLVVIAIITVLIAIALPVFSRAREKARQTACMANLHQLAMAVRMYRMDMGTYPGPYDPASGTGGLNDLYPAYVSSRKVFICPDDLVDTGEKYVEQKVLVERRHEWDRQKNTSELRGREVSYRELLATASALYADVDPDYWVNMWLYSGPNPTPTTPYDPTFFVEHYSSYNGLYNWAGYIYRYIRREPDETEEDYWKRFDEVYTFSLCDLEQELLLPGESVAFWYVWHKWDPENTLGVWRSNEVYDLVNSQLHYHLAQQTYWRDYDPWRLEEQQFRLLDSLRRPLWDPGNPDQSAYDYMPYGIPSPVFPGLINRNAPDSTIITRCIHHRPYRIVPIPRRTGPPAGRDGPGGRGGPGGSGVTTEIQRDDTSPQDIVLRLDGSAVFVTGLNYDWATQPESTH